MSADFSRTISIQVVDNGFILTYPTSVVGTDTESGIAIGIGFNLTQEIFVSPRKLFTKVKNIIDQLQEAK